MANENREYKDTVFTDLFYTDEDAEKNLLSLYNALYGTNLTDTGAIQKYRLEDILFKNFKNDIAFVVENRSIILGEHQSTVNPNMPLRNLMYIGREYERLVPTEQRYRSKLAKIPTPEFITFYNGEVKQPDEQIMRLSDAFMESTDKPMLELYVRVLNINYKHNPEILKKCQVLREYSIFVDRVRKHKSDKNALEQAIKECIAEGILPDYLRRRGGEVMSYLMDEYDYETDIRVQREEAAEEAAEEMRKEKELVEKKLAEVQKEALLERERAEEKVQAERRKTEEKARAEREKAQAALYEQSRNTARRLLALKQFSVEQIAEIAGMTLGEAQAISEECENR